MIETETNDTTTRGRGRPPKVVTTAEALQILGVSPTTLRRRIADAAIIPYKVDGNRRYYRRSAIEALAGKAGAAN